MLADQEAVVVLLQDGHELEEGVGRRTSSTVTFLSSRLRMREWLLGMILGVSGWAE